MSDGYAVIRKSTLAYLLEAARVAEMNRDVPEEVARDLSVAVEGVAAPDVDEDRLRAAGPLLTLREHVELLSADPELDLPIKGQSAEFWQVVTKITLTVLRNEAEAVRRVIAARGEDE
jgi:hypothetical protein